MKKIDGNTVLQIQKNVVGFSDLGEPTDSWTNTVALKGTLDLVTGNVSKDAYKAPFEDSTHIFIADYKEISNDDAPDGSRALIAGETYQVKYIDDPMRLHEHLEIYLKFLGDENGR